MTTITLPRAVVEQALDDLKDLQANHNIMCAGTISRLEAALAQEQAEQTWVCPEAPEERTYSKPGHCENCGKTLVLLQEQAEPVQEPVAYRHLHEDGWEYYDAPTGEDCAGCQALYTAPQKLVPLTDEEIIDATEHIDTSRDGYFIDIARAIERAHGIGDNT